MAADVNRDSAFLHRLRITLHWTEVEMFAVERRRVVAPQHAQRFDRLVGASAAGVEVEAERSELFFEPSTADSENRASIREYVERGRLFGDVQWMALRENQYSGAELDFFGHRSRERERQQRIGNRHIFAAWNFSTGRVWVRRFVVLRDHDMLDRPQRLDPASLGGGREMREQSGIAEGPGVNEHQSKFHFFSTSFQDVAV